VKAFGWGVLRLNRRVEEGGNTKEVRPPTSNNRERKKRIKNPRNHETQPEEIPWKQ